MRSHILDPMLESDAVLKVRNIIWDYEIEESFKYLKRMVSSDNLFYCYNNYYDKQLGDVISHNNKPIAFISTRLTKPQHSYTTIWKEIILILE